MPKKEHPEEQIIAALKQQEAGSRRPRTFAASSASARRRFTCGSGSMPGWECRSYANCGNCGRRTGG